MLQIRKGNGPSTGLTGIVLAGLLVFAFPLTALTAQTQRLSAGTPLRVNIDTIDLDNTGVTPRYRITTPLTRISTSTLTGDNDFVENQTVFVFMSPGPGDIWYPYAISKRPPDPGCGTDKCLTLKGRVTDIARDSLMVRYAFDRFNVPQSYRGTHDQWVDGEIEIRINKNGHSTLRSMRAADVHFDQRNWLNWTLPASSNRGASNAPAINPPR